MNLLIALVETVMALTSVFTTNFLYDPVETMKHFIDILKYKNI